MLCVCRESDVWIYQTGSGNVAALMCLVATSSSSLHPWVLEVGEADFLGAASVAPCGVLAGLYSS